MPIPTTSTRILRDRALQFLALASILVGGARSADAAGILAPTDPSVPPLRVTDHLVEARVHDGVAITSITQTFRNDTKRRLEATYVFPLPEDADLTDFQMSFNGKMAKGRVLPKDEAARIYESIVRQSRDPGLIEFIGRRLLQMRVFPIEPESETTIQMQYQQICRSISGMRGYHYPLRTRKTAGQAYGSVRFSVSLETTAPLKSIWSPTHGVEIVRKPNEREADVAYEAEGGSLEDDFLLLFDTDSSDLGLSVVAHKTGDDPGHFVLMLTPKQLWPSAAYEPQDVVFVLDTSGSMSDGKLEQAQGALKFCIDRLDERDRFNVVRFSTGFDLLAEDLLEATAESKKSARRWVEQFSANGGTNIADTLVRVAELARNRSLRETRSFVVVFLTDGRGNGPPAVALNRLAEAAEGAGTMHVFPFGVGHKVNTKLLDRLAAEYGGRTTYVQPGENLELVLGDFFSVISRPVLTNLRLALPAIGATERFPASLGDLYHGQQLILAGRYTDEMKGPVTLTATRGGAPVEFAWPQVSFESTEDAAYVATVWAGRKIAYLIDQIRTHGESTEMVEEILALSQKYGIQTPYTSWLVNPEGSVRPVVGRRRAPGSGGFGLGRAGAGGERRSAPSEKRAPPAAAARRLEREFRGAAGGGGSLFGDPGTGEIAYGDEDLRLDSKLAERAVTEEYGAAANLIARKNAEMKELLSRDQGRFDLSQLPYRKIGDRWYNRIGGLLVDEAFGEETKVMPIRFASEAYFELVRARPDLRAALAASRDVVVMMSPGEAILVSQRVGADAFTEADRERLGL